MFCHSLYLWSVSFFLSLYCSYYTEQWKIIGIRNKDEGQPRRILFGSFKG